MALPTRAQRVLRSIRQAIPTGVVLGRRSAGFGPAEFVPLSEIQQAQLDAISAVQGSILYRGASAWAALAPGTAGHFLKTNGASANPAWAAASSGGVLFNPPLAADFPTSVNDGSSSTTFTDDADHGLLLSLTTSSGTINFGLRLKSFSLPSSGQVTTITMGAKYSPTSVSNGNPRAGLVLRSSAADRRLWFGFTSAPANPIAHRIEQRTGTTLVAGGPSQTNNLSEATWWFRVTIDDAGDMEFFYSSQGAIWHSLATTTLATYLISVDQVGFIVGGISGNEGAFSIFYYTQVTA